MHNISPACNRVVDTHNVIFLYRAFCDKLNRARLDHLFSLLFEKTLAKPPGESNKDGCVNKLPDIMPGVQWLNLPLAVEVRVTFLPSMVQTVYALRCQPLEM